MDNRVIYGKVLLFGEYSLIAGSKALTIPFRQFSGRLKFFSAAGQASGAPASMNPEDSNNLLQKLIGYLYRQSFKSITTPAGVITAASDLLNLEVLEHDIQQGLYFDATIPGGYGVGSSGALVAALFDKYHKGPDLSGTDEGLLALKAFFGAVESYFHGTSSGIDPLSCYLGKPLLLEESGVPRTVEIKTGDKNQAGGFFLIDTGQAGLTAPLVRLFYDKQKQSQFAEFLHHLYIPVVNGSITAIIENNADEIQDRMYMLSDYQYGYFREMIPPSFLPLWKRGLQTGAYSMKLCGSGGGGYLLGYTPDYQNNKEITSPLHMTLLPLAF